MDNKLKKKIINEIKNQLSIILSNASSFGSPLSDKNFSNIISKNINMLAQLEEKEKVKSSSDFLDKFNVILKNKISEIKPSNFKEEFEFNDEIQYLKVYLKNSFDININNFNIDKSKIDDLSKLDKTENIKKEDNPNSSNFQNDSSSFQQNPYGNPEIYRETIISQMINKRISDDYINGNYYFFLTKPKIIPILKTISGVFLIIAALLFIAQMVVTILTSNAGVKIKVDTSEIPLSSSIMSYVLLAFEAIILGYSSMAYFKKSSNDNFKYKPNNLIYYLLFLLGIMSIYNSVDSILLYENEINTYDGNTYEAKEMYKLYSYLSLSINIFLISFIIFPMLNYIYKPQENRELKAMLYEKYRKEIEDLGLVK